MKQFEIVELSKPESSVFDWSHEFNATIEIGKLVPIFWDEVVPGQKIVIKPETLVRFQPMLAPIMHRIDLKIEAFFVPNEIIWDDWKTFITGGKTADTVINHPKITDTHDKWYDSAYTQIGSLSDYLGVPIKNAVNGSGEYFPSVSKLPYRAYLEIYNQYYRDQNLITEVSYGKTSTDSTLASMGSQLELRKRAWEKDYLTSCTPTPNKGSEVNLPLGGTAPVTGQPAFTTLAGVPTGAGALSADVDSMLTHPSGEAKVSSGLTADLSGATGSTVREFRWAMKVQQYLERLMLVGSRYYEYIQGIFGFTPSFARMDIPEFLGGSKIPIQVSEVLKTANEAVGSEPVGTMNGHAVAAGELFTIEKVFEEHGIIMIIASVVPKTKYSQGIERKFQRFTKEDYLNPFFATVGDQEIYNREVYVQTLLANNNLVFGYQERYAEYKYKNDRIAGDLRDTLKFWTMARKWSSAPALNEEFIDIDEEDYEDIFAVEGSRPVILQAYFDIKTVLPLPKYSTPRM